MKKNGLIMLWTIVFLAGCANLPAPTHPPARRTPVLQITITPTITPTITRTMIILPEPMPTATPDSRFTQQCLPIADREVELKEVASGTILFYNPSPDERLTLKDAQTGDEYKLSAETKHVKHEYSQISPNRKMIAQMEWDLNDQIIAIRNVLWVFDARAKVLSKITFNRTGLRQPRWLDDERLLIDTEKYGTLLLVNPFTGEQRMIANKLPNLYPYFEAGLWWPVMYSPDLEWVAYYSAREENSGYMEGPVVYDLEAKKTLWGAANGVGSNPAWSPDGQEVAFAGGMDEYQLYLISRSGQIKAVLGENQPHKAAELSWSPDGRYIAFWNDDSLMVYERQTNQVFDTCISGDGMENPVWSPDSQKVIINTYSAQPILVDWQKKIAYKIKYIPNRVISGWMNSLP
jgi:hypothetical protein